MELPDILNIGVTLISGTVLYYVRRNDKKTDDISSRLESLEKFISSELRLMDVRLTKIEMQIWPNR